MPFIRANSRYLLVFLALLIYMCRNENSKSSISMNDSNTAYEISKMITVPPEKLFAVFLNSNDLRKILGVSSITVDARPGGQAIAKYQNGDSNLDFTLTFKEIIPNKKLRWIVHFDQSPGKEIMTTLTFEKIKDGTNIIVRQENFTTPQERDENKKTWEETLIKLDALTNWK